MKMHQFKNRPLLFTNRPSLLVPAALMLALLLSAPCAAQTGLGLTLATPTITAGTSATSQVFTFNGTLTNTSSASLYLNGDLFTLDAPLDEDDSAFADVFLLPTDPSGNPLPSLGMGQSLSLALFNITVPAGTALGAYSGLFEIQGGATSSDFGLLAAQSFTVTTSAKPAPAVPEVPSGSALVVGLLMTAGLVAARRRKAAAMG